MINFKLFSLLFSFTAFCLSILALYQSFKSRQADRFAKLYDEFNTSTFGADMECIGEWLGKLACSLKRERDKLGDHDVQKAYWIYLQDLRKKGENTKTDPLEKARRSIKAFHIKCLLYKDGRDISRAKYKALITHDRALLIQNVIYMTRAQTFWWKYPNQPLDLLARISSDEPHFKRIESKIRNGFYDQFST